MTPVPSKRRIIASAQFTAEDEIKIIGNDDVFSEEMTTEQNNIVVLYEPMSKRDIIINLKSKPRVF